MITNLKFSRPWFFENSKIPVLLSYVSPIDIGAITIGPLVFSRGEMTEQTKTHETIHWQQYIETGILGFIFLYYLYYLIGYLKYKDGQIAYFQIPFEQEAYEHDKNMYYPVTRKRYAWRKKKI
jgi:hypothetical protein